MILRPKLFSESVTVVNHRELFDVAEAPPLNHEGSSEVVSTQRVKFTHKTTYKSQIQTQEMLRLAQRVVTHVTLERRDDKKRGSQKYTQWNKNTLRVTGVSDCNRSVFTQESRALCETAEGTKSFETIESLLKMCSKDQRTRRTQMH